MESYRLVFRCMNLLVVLTNLSLSESFSILVPDDVIIAPFGEDLVLSCQLSPRTSAEAMKVTWSKEGYDSPVHIAQRLFDKSVEYGLSYRDRARLLTSELLNGSVSLQLKNVRVSDEGTYVCTVNSTNMYDEGEINVLVVGAGKDPLIYMDGYIDNGIRIGCKSSGWYPKPEIKWTDGNNETLTVFSKSIDEQEDGLFNVDSQVVIKDSKRSVVCHIANSLNGRPQKRESSLMISDDLFPSISIWESAFLSLVVLVVIAVLIVCLYLAWKRSRLSEAEKEFKEAQSHFVNITLDRQTAHPSLSVSKDLKSVQDRDNQQPLLDRPESFDTCACILGTEGFTSGKHFWQVEVGARTKWKVGVAKESANRKGGVTVSTDHGYWALCLRNGTDYRALTSPSTKLTLCVKPSKIGVYLDYEGGRVSFYNVDNKSLIYTFNDKFTEKMFPFFSLCATDGGQDDEPLRIYSCTEI
ncbi:butyrophilin subfamily 1 member A1 [Latimeria chalumnae]|uniref:butyrophilin subfamily 1 member A1 n=1 Tax=Latimeria chalumnae TaxID=7897 RepID=UPI00313F3295